MYFHTYIHTYIHTYRSQQHDMKNGLAQVSDSDSDADALFPGSNNPPSTPTPVVMETLSVRYVDSEISEIS